MFQRILVGCLIYKIVFKNKIRTSLYLVPHLHWTWLSTSTDITIKMEKMGIYWPATPCNPGKPGTPWDPLGPSFPWSPYPGGPGNPTSPRRPGLPVVPGGPLSPFGLSDPWE